MINLKAHEIKNDFLTDEELENNIRICQNMGYYYSPLTERQKNELIANGFSVTWEPEVSKHKIDWNDGLMEKTNAKIEELKGEKVNA